MQNVLCPICHVDNSIEIFNIGDLNKPLRNVLCMTCGLVYINPRPEEAEYLAYQGSSGLGSGHHSRTESLNIQHKIDKSDRRIKSKVFDYIASYITPNARILDIGCGFGTLLSIIRERTGITGDGIELSERDVRVAREVFNLDLFHGTVENFYAQYDRNRQFDLIILHHTLEHFIAPVEELGRIHDLLDRDGALYIGVPNIMNMKKRPEIFFQLGHATSFTSASLSNMLHMAGFKIVHFNRNAAYPGGMELVAKKDMDVTEELVYGLQEGRDPKGVFAYVHHRARQFRLMRRLRDSLFFWLPRSIRIKIGRIVYLWQKKH